MGAMEGGGEMTHGAVFASKFSTAVGRRMTDF